MKQETTSVTRAFFGISARLPLPVFVALLREVRVELIVDVRSWLPSGDAWHHPSALHYLCTEHLSVGYLREQTLCPTPATVEVLERGLHAGDRMAWTRFLQEYMAALKREVSTVNSVITQVCARPRCVAFLGDAEHADDCHRSALLGFLKERDPMLEVRELSSEQIGIGTQPVRLEPRRFRTASVPEAGLLPDAVGAGARLRGYVLSCMELEPSKFWIDVLVPDAAGPRTLSLRVPSRNPIDAMWLGLDRSGVFRSFAPGAKIEFQLHDYPGHMKRIETHPEEILTVAATVIPVKNERPLTSKDLAQTVAEFVFPSVMELFPGAVRRSNNAYVVLADAKMPRSSGYVRATSVTFSPKDKRALIYLAGTSIWACVHDQEWLELMRVGEVKNDMSYKDMLVRLVLLPVEDDPNEDGVRCCRVAVAHILIP